MRNIRSKGGREWSEMIFSAAEFIQHFAKGPGAQDLRLVSEPPVNIVCRMVTQLACAKSRYHMRIGQDRAFLDGRHSATAESELQPLAYRIGNGVVVRGDRKPVLMVPDDLLEF